MTIGRPTLYKPEYAEQTRKLCTLGATDIEIADFFDVSLATVKKWKAAHPLFVAALKAGKSEADERVERSLYHKAVGYTFESEKVFQFQGNIVRTETREHVPPDTTAMIFWLKNRRPEQWRDKTEHVIRHEASQMSDDDLARIAAASSDRAATQAVNPKELN